MMIYSIGEFIVNLNNKNTDALGLSIDYWLSYGTVGWDEPMDTYFIQLDNEYWFGSFYQEIKTIEKLKHICYELFGNDVTFNEKTINSLKQYDKNVKDEKENIDRLYLLNHRVDES